MRQRRAVDNAASSEDSSGGGGGASKVTLLVDTPVAKKYQGFVTRASWSLVMVLACLFAVVYTQQTGCATLVFICQVMMYQELMQIGRVREREGRIFSLLPYWFFLTVEIGMYSLALPIDSSIERFIPMLCFISWVLSVVVFVLCLRKRDFKYQFSRFAMSHTVLLVVITQSSLLVANIWSGLIWFLLPVSMVVANDVFAYIFGFFFGRTPLIQLSPKKTWEGFIGGFMSTIVIGFIMSRILSLFPLMTCAPSKFDLQYWPSCEVDAVFARQPLYALVKEKEENLVVFGALWEYLKNIEVMPLDLHTLIFSLFASLVAPFGGFFASGFKRAFKIKDFGNFIPGHGGITDRMDCQIVMGAFVFMYLRTFVYVPGHQSLSQDISEIIQKLSVEQLEKVKEFVIKSL